MSRRGENIHKRKDGRWEGRYRRGRDDNGRIIYGFVYGKTYREAKEKLWAMGGEQQTAPIKQKELEFRQLLYIWLKKNRPYHKRSTMDKYELLIETHIVPELGRIKISRISPDLLCDFSANKLERGRLDGQGGLAPSYVRTMMLIIRSTLVYGAEEKICRPLNPPSIKIGNMQKTPDILDLREQRRLEAYLRRTEDGVGVGILLSLYMGLRIGEVCALSWEDMDLENRILYVRHTVMRIRNPYRPAADSPHTLLVLEEPKTKCSLRCIPIPDRLISTLSKRKMDSDSNYVVSNQASFMSPRTYEYRFHRILEFAGIRSVNYHVLRHTFATRCVEAGADVKTISELLGHANVAVTLNIYVHSSIERKRAQIEKIACLLERNEESKQESAL